jgi:wyosine [tRNA(Phe)-imidazoG37] synthetase (radical SAM superfamily)
MGAYRHLFGPVMSRRLGLSLGVELVREKTCSYDCVFCQIGRTPRTSLERACFVPVQEVLEEFSAWLAAGGRADHITLAGAGEPTLHSGFGEVLAGLAQRSPIPTVLMSNGSLFYLPEVREAAARASIVKVSLSAWDEASWRRLNHPHPDLRFEQVLKGLQAFAGSFSGTFWVEVFLVKGINDQPGQVARIAALVNALNPTRVHLNTVVRPPADSASGAVAEPVLLELAGLFDPPAEVTPPVAAVAGAAAGAGAGLLETVTRHPSTLDQLVASLKRDRAGLSAELDALEKAGEVERVETAGLVYFRRRQPGPSIHPGVDVAG